MAGGGQHELDALVLRQVVQRHRSPGLRQVFGRGHHHQRRVHQLAGDQAGVRLRAGAHRQVEAIRDEVHVAVAQMHLDLHLRVAAAKARQQAQHAVVPQGGGHADAQHTRRRRLAARQLALGLHQLVERLSALRQVGPTSLGQADPAGAAHEQAHLQARLQPSDGPADRRRRETGLRRGSGEAFQLRRQAEKLDAAEHHRVELPGHELLHVMNELK